MTLGFTERVTIEARPSCSGSFSARVDCIELVRTGHSETQARPASEARTIYRARIERHLQHTCHACMSCIHRAHMATGLASTLEARLIGSTFITHADATSSHMHVSHIYNTMAVPRTHISVGRTRPPSYVAIGSFYLARMGNLAALDSTIRKCSVYFPGL